MSKPTEIPKLLEATRRNGGLRFYEVAQLLGATPSTVSRWYHRRSSPSGGRLQRLLELDWLLDHLADVCYPDEARRWLFAPYPLLRAILPR